MPTEKAWTFTQRLAEYFLERPNQWIDGRELAQIAGAYAWRSRVSDLRRPPFNLKISNRQRTVRTTGGSYTVSEYKLVELSVSAGLEAV